MRPVAHGAFQRDPVALRLLHLFVRPVSFYRFSTYLDAGR
jgi:hypothetical protein